ncbi:MAG TPA: L-threonylcarbamoyladenylate synthase [Candidatus Solibacter sp.]|nr:L-threonylcarbamoyladenylate synthase [Candidatus Solibacter sp.]
MSRLEPAGTTTSARAAALLDAGALVCFPTDTVYAVAGVADIAATRDRLYAAKRRQMGQPMALLAASADALMPWVTVDDRARELMGEFWPGALTLVLVATPRAVAELGQVVRDGTLGVRVPDHPDAISILRSVAHPVAASSANIHGAPAPITGAEALANMEDSVELVVDGRCEIGMGSSILDLTLPEPRLLREGSIPAQRLLR